MKVSFRVGGNFAVLSHFRCLRAFSVVFESPRSVDGRWPAAAAWPRPQRCAGLVINTSMEIRRRGRRPETLCPLLVGCHCRAETRRETRSEVDTKFTMILIITSFYESPQAGFLPIHENLDTHLDHNRSILSIFALPRISIVNSQHQSTHRRFP